MGIIFTDILKPEEAALSHHIKCTSEDDEECGGVIKVWKEPSHESKRVLFGDVPSYGPLSASELEAIAAKMRELETIK